MKLKSQEKHFMGTVQRSGQQQPKQIVESLKCGEGIFPFFPSKQLINLWFGDLFVSFFPPQILGGTRKRIFFRIYLQVIYNLSFH